MKKRHQKKGVHLLPILIGAFLIFMGIAEVWMGTDRRWTGTNSIEKSRCLMGVAVFCLGLWGVWDGLRDLFTHKPPTEEAPGRQFVFRDVDGRQSSYVDRQVLRTQMELMRQRGSETFFSLEILPALEIEGRGWLERIDCTFLDSLRLLAHFVDDEGACIVRKKDVDFAQAETILTQLLSGLVDFSGWKLEKTKAEPSERKFNQLLVINGENGSDQFEFFTARDLELAVEGLASGEYEWVDMYLGLADLHLNAYEPEEEGEDQIALHLVVREAYHSTHYSQASTVEQAKAWAVSIFNGGLSRDLEGLHDLGRMMGK